MENYGSYSKQIKADVFCTFNCTFLGKGQFHEMPYSGTQRPNCWNAAGEAEKPTATMHFGHSIETNFSNNACNRGPAVLSKNVIKMLFASFGNILQCTHLWLQLHLGPAFSNRLYSKLLSVKGCGVHLSPFRITSPLTSC